ncbi:MAG: hypothetical protein J6S21_01410, partial [Victivallales bacterium]|nr:hypothetical protein [Victivallales bacterium]
YSAAHQNGICFFFDRQGNDKYGRYIPIPKSTNQYHLGSSLGIFIDTGSGNDEYVSRTNNSSATEEGDHIFVDR